MEHSLVNINLGESVRKQRLAILVAIVTPYRLPLYEHLNEFFETLVLVSGREDNRHWSFDSVGVRIKRAAGLTLKWKQGDNGRVHDLRYTHFNPGYLWDLFRFRPDAVISAEMGFRSAIALLYGFVARKPVLIWWGGTLHTERDRSRPKRVLRRLFAATTPRWMSEGRTSTEYLERILGVSRDRIVEIQNCVDDTLFKADVEPAVLQGGHPRALVVGQLIGRKGLEQLLEAAAQLQREGLIFSLVMVGEGPDRSRLEHEAQVLGIEHVYWLGHVPASEMPSVYRACEVLVFPTLEDVWGMVVNEALLCGIPVICSTFAGCATELLPEQNIFDPTDREAFANILRAAVMGTITGPDLSCLRSTRDVGSSMIRGVVQAANNEPA